MRRGRDAGASRPLLLCIISKLANIKDDKFIVVVYIIIVDIFVKDLLITC